MSLRKKLIRLAHANPGLQSQLLPLLKESAAKARVNSIADGIEQGCLALAQSLESYVFTELRDVIDASRNSMILGPYRAGFDADLVNDIDPSKKGYLLVNIEWDVRKGEPVLVLVISYPGHKHFRRDFMISRDLTAGQIVPKHGKALIRWVDDYLMEITKAYNK